MSGYPTIVEDRGRGGGGRVLVVSGDPRSREHLEGLLFGRFLVEPVASVQAALDAVRRRPPDVVLADAALLKADHFGLLYELRADPRTRWVPVLLLSARPGDEAAIEGLEAGAHDSVAELCSARELLARITLRRELSGQRAALEADRAKLRALLLDAPFGVGVFQGPDHRIVLANRRWEELIGHPLPAGVRLVDAIPELRGQPVIDAHDRAYAGETVVFHDVPAAIRGPGGELEHHYFQSIFQPIRDEHGRITGHMVLGVEVTAEVLAREELDAARRAAESASRAKDEFLALLGHELRNPLAPIVTALDLMEMRGVKDCDRERAIIRRQVDHLSTLVDDLLDVSRITRGKVTLSRRRIELADIVSLAVETVSPLFQQRGQHVTVDVPRPGLCVDADPDRIQQVVSNLLTNAAKYTDVGGRIHVVAEREHDQAVLRVRDTGIGIDPEMLPRIFDMFVQERQALDRARGGLGLGLTLVKSLVTLHGGSVSAHSEGRGKGTEIVVRLPLAPGAGAVAAPERSSAPAPSARGRRILIVDDNEDAADMLAEIVESLGNVARVAHDGPAALRMLADFTPDVALLDIGLPAMDGYELARRIRATPAGASMRIIAVTGYGQDSDRERSREAGFDAHLVKPLDVDRLLRAIDGP